MTTTPFAAATASGTAPLDAAGVDGFVRRLRGTFAEIYPANWQIDWQNVPSPFRWYDELPRIDLPPLPRKLIRGDGTAAGRVIGRGTADWLGALLHAGYGLTGVRWYPEGIAKSSPEEPTPVHRDPHYQLRRTVPSGGVTFPAECYLGVSAGDAEVPPGVYHYDATRHALVRLAEGPPPAGVGRADGGLRLTLTVPLWKNHFKYGDFSYRLAAMDTGAVVGQFAVAARQWGLRCRVSFGVDEPELLAQLGLDGDDEAAPVVLDIGPGADAADDRAPARVGTRTWRGRGRVDPAAGARRMHAACLLAARPGAPLDLPPIPVGDLTIGDTALPEVTDEPATIGDALARTALGEQFRSEPVAAREVARWMAQVAAPLDCDVPGAGDGITHPRCLLLAGSVTGLAPGAYFPLPGGRLAELATGAFGGLVQESLFGSYMNFGQAPLIAVLVGTADPQHGPNGPVGYRGQHLLAGVLAQRLAVAVSRDGCSAHPVLGFVSKDLDGPLGLAERGLTALLVIGIGRYRRALYLESGLNPAAGVTGDRA
jgi:SagB-type dehydrogenase family enzyme